MLVKSDELKSGSIGATTYAHNRFGQYARRRSTPVNPQSTPQVQARARMSLLSNLWNTALTADQRQAWDNYAANVPMQNRLGDQIYVTGFNMYCRANALVLQSGLTRVDDGPVLYLKGEQDPTFAVAISEGTQLISVTFDVNLDWVGEDEAALMCYMGDPKATNINFYNGPWLFADSIEGDSVTPPTSPATIAVPKFVAEGQKVWVRARVIRADGRVSDPFSGFCTTGA